MYYWKFVDAVNDLCRAQSRISAFAIIKIVVIKYLVRLVRITDRKRWWIAYGWCRTKSYLRKFTRKRWIVHFVSRLCCFSLLRYAKNLFMECLNLWTRFFSFKRNGFYFARTYDAVQRYIALSAKKSRICSQSSRIECGSWLKYILASF